ncbi:MAG: MarR family winged helix-turn-helix transcriptional regulator [Acidobacteriota bacterium]
MKGKLPTVNDIVDMALQGSLSIPALTNAAKLYPTLSGTDAMALLLVFKREGSKMSVLAEQMNVPMSTATGIIGRLARQGYVERTHSTEDRRVITIGLTDKGREVVEQIYENAQGLLDQVLAGMKVDEVIHMMSLVSKAINVLSQPEPTVKKEQKKPKIRRITIE